MPVSHLASLRHRAFVVAIVGALAVALAAVAVALTVPASSSAPTTVSSSAPQPTDEPHHPEEAWWSILVRRLPARARVRAEGGAGFVNPGLIGCAGHTFAEQLAEPLVDEAVAGAGAVVIEGGRTDTQTCREGRRSDPPRLHVH